MRLQYVPERDQWRGARLTVAGEAFRHALAHFLDDGTDEEAALDLLLREAAWSLDMVGVTARAAGEPSLIPGGTPDGSG